MMNSPDKMDNKKNPNHVQSKSNDFTSGNQPNNLFESQDYSKQKSQHGRAGGKFQHGNLQNQRSASSQSPYTYEQDKSARNNRSGEKGSRSRGKSSNSGGHWGSSRGFYGDKVKEKITEMFTEPQIDLPPLDMSERKFNNHAKLFIGNIPKNCEQKEIVDLFEKYGEIGSVYMNKDSGFAFINFDFKANATKALQELDKTVLKNRPLKVRFATLSEGIRVKNLSPYVSNELLEKVFTIFGMVEYCRVSVDERGMSKGEGTVIFRDKKAATLATKKCQEECFFLSGALRPVVVTTLEPRDDHLEGLTESSLPKNEEYLAERRVMPHIAEHNSFEYEFGLQWKQLFNMYTQKKAVLDNDFQIELERLEKKMVLAKVEYETDKLRKELAQREAASAQLRRHFDFNTGGGPSPGTGSASYDPYAGSKRQLEQAYDGSFSGSYDQAYSNYGREDYRREGAYGSNDAFDRASYDLVNTTERPPIFDNSTEKGFAKLQESSLAGGNPFTDQNKRPRY